MNQSKFAAILCNLLKARENSRVPVATGFGFPFDWLINWREIFKPIKKRSNINRAIILSTVIWKLLYRRKFCYWFIFPSLSFVIGVHYWNLLVHVFPRFVPAEWIWLVISMSATTTTAQNKLCWTCGTHFAVYFCGTLHNNEVSIQM